MIIMICVLWITVIVIVFLLCIMVLLMMHSLMDYGYVLFFEYVNRALTIWVGMFSSLLVLNRHNKQMIKVTKA